MLDSLFIDDGYTETRTIPAVPGLYPEMRVVYRPALDRERNAWRIKGQSADPAVLDQHLTDLIIKYTVSINGQELKDKDKVTRLKPAIRGHLSDLILGYLPADEAKDMGNSPTG